MSGSSGRSSVPGTCSTGRSRAEHNSKPCRTTAHSVRKRCSNGGANGRIPETTANRGPVGLNWGWYQNKELDALADKVQASFDPTEQTKILQQMHEMVETAPTEG